MTKNWFSEFMEYISPDGKVYKFDGAVDRFSTLEEGFGMPEIDYITQQGPFQHGETIIDYRLKPRTIQFTHTRRTSSRYEYWNARSDIINMLRPNRNVGKKNASGVLRKYLPDGSMRDLYVNILQGPVFSTRDSSSWRETQIDEVIRFVAPDPIFFDPKIVTVNPTNNQYAGLNFPITFPITFGLSLFEASFDITYPGTWETYPTFQLYGPLQGPHIYNDSTGEELFLDYKINSGEVVTIALSAGRKIIVNNHNINLKGSLRGNLSNLATFHIAHDPEVAGGQNRMRVTGSNYVNGVTHIVMSYYNRYIGF